MWFDNLEESFSFQFKSFCQPMKTSCPPAQNVDEFPEYWEVRIIVKIIINQHKLIIKYCLSHNVVTQGVCRNILTAYCQSSSMRSTGYAKPYKPLCYAVIGSLATAVIGAFRSSLFQWVVVRQTITFYYYHYYHDEQQQSFSTNYFLVYRNIF